MASVVENLSNQMASQVSAARNASTSSNAGLSDDSKTLADNYQTFLTLLTTQLKHQDPTAPLDTNQFMQQLTQFSSVEQGLKTNDTLSKILTNLTGNASTTAVSYLGTQVTAEGTTAELNNGSANWALNFPKKPEGVSTVTIRDANGAVVFTDKAAEFNSGLQNYTWNGTNLAGGTAPEGNYTISVSAKDSFGTDMTVGTQVSGRVTAVEVAGDEPLLTVGGRKIKLSSVTSVGI